MNNQCFEFVVVCVSTVGQNKDLINNNYCDDQATLFLNTFQKLFVHTSQSIYLKPIKGTESVKRISTELTN